MWRREAFIYVFSISLLISGCSAQNKFQVLSFFFDGVPDQTSQESSVEIDSLYQADSDTTSFLSEISSQKMHFHQPYKERNCASCHNKGRMGSLQQKQPDLCYQCHENIRQKFKYDHGPSASGFCTECHHPHQSNHDNLLTATGQELCNRCHNPDKIKQSIYHNFIEQESCTVCHNPHGSNEHSLLKIGTCYLCHENFSKQFKTLHGPVSANHCSLCHKTHRSGITSLRVKSNYDLCYSCHDKNRILGTDTHSDLGEMQCLECHNPHGGEDRYMFK